MVLLFSTSFLLIQTLWKAKDRSDRSEFHLILYQIRQKAWKFISKSIPQKTFTEPGFDIWNIPRLEMGARLFQSITMLSLLVAHIRDFEKIPDMDEQGEKQLHGYFDHLNIQVNPIYQEVLDSVTEMASVCEDFTIPQLEKRPDLTAAMQGLIELRKVFFDFKGEFTLNTQEMVEWAGQLEKARDTAFAIYLFWVADILEEEGV